MICLSRKGHDEPGNDEIKQNHWVNSQSTTILKTCVKFLQLKLLTPNF